MRKISSGSLNTKAEKFVKKNSGFIKIMELLLQLPSFLVPLAAAVSFVVLSATKFIGKNFLDPSSSRSVNGCCNHSIPLLVRVADEKFSNEDDALNIAPFYISKYEITNRQYNEFLTYCESLDSVQVFCEVVSGEVERTAPMRDNEARVRVTWEQAGAYTNWLSARSNERFRLAEVAELRLISDLPCLGVLNLDDGVDEWADNCEREKKGCVSSYKISGIDSVIKFSEESKSLSKKNLGFRVVKEQRSSFQYFINTFQSGMSLVLI